MSFTVLHWNILADALSTQDSFPRVPDERRTWANRAARVSALIGAVKPEPDALSLVEVEPHQLEAIKGVLAAHKFQHLIKYGGGLDGTALGWAGNATAERVEAVRFPGMSQVIVAARLQLRCAL